MNEAEKIYSKILGLFVFFTYLFIAFLVFLFIGIYRVDAAFYDVNVNSISAQYYGSTATLMGGINVNNSNGFKYFSQDIIPPKSPSLIQPDQIATIFYVFSFDTINIKSNSHNSISISYSTNLGLEPSEFLVGGRSYSTSCNVQNLSFDDRPMYYYNCNLEFDWLNTSFDLSSIRVYFNHSGNAENGAMVHFSVRGRMYYYNLQNTVEAIDTFKQQSHDDAIAQQNQDKKIAEEQKKRDEEMQKKQDETNNKLDDVNDNITDSNVDSSSNTASGFFNSFKDNDHGGLSGIITSPLVAINEMLKSSCNSLSCVYKNKKISLPSGCDFWNRIPVVKDFLNVIEGGYLCYLIIRKMFLLVQDLKNPENDRIEVMEL